MPCHAERLFRIKIKGMQLVKVLSVATFPAINSTFLFQNSDDLNLKYSDVYPVICF